MTHLFQIPVALYEVLSLVEQVQAEGFDQADKMKELMESIIDTALNDPESWLKIKEMANSGHKVALTPVSEIESAA